MTSQYYVYGLTDPRKQEELFYLGKGKGKRCKQHFYKSGSHNNRLLRYKIRGIREAGLEPGLIFFKKEISNLEACDLEVLLIKKYGRIGYDKNGILANVCLGGVGGRAGKQEASLQERVKISLTNSQKYLVRIGEINQEEPELFIEKLRNYFLAVKDSNLPRNTEVIQVMDTILEQRKFLMLHKNITVSELKKSEEYKKYFHTTHKDYPELIRIPKEPKGYVTRTANEYQYMLSNKDGEVYNLGAKALTKFCLERNIKRFNLMSCMGRNKLHNGWKLVREDTEHNRNVKTGKHSDETRKIVSEKLKGKKRTPEQKQHAKEVQQRTYSITDPNMKNYTIKSADIQTFCATFKLCYTTLITAKNQKRPYKKWTIVEVPKN